MSGTDKGRARGGFKASRHATGARASAAGNKSAQKKAAEQRRKQAVVEIKVIAALV